MEYNIIEYVNQFKHLNYIENHIVIAGGLSFNNPKLSNHPEIIDVTIHDQDISKYAKIVKENEDNPIINNIGKRTEFYMASQAKRPIFIKKIIPQKLKDVNVIGKNTGIMDMWIKQSGNEEIIIPKELIPLKAILIEAYKFEKYTNPNILNWNMWLLVDLRPVKKFHTQRNSGYHYDGMALAGKHQNCQVTSIYSWTNKLPTKFYTGTIHYPINFKPNHNANIIAQKQTKNPNEIFTSKNYCLYKFDATTVHTGVESEIDLDDRIFIRICFTAPDVLFDRKGNTINPCIDYSKFTWRIVKDPIVTFKSLIIFESPEEFKNLWDVACQGHPAFSCQYEGSNSFEYKLINELRRLKFSFVREIIKLYDKEINQNNNIVAEIRKNILINKYF